MIFNALGAEFYSKSLIRNFKAKRGVFWSFGHLRLLDLVLFVLMYHFITLNIICHIEILDETLDSPSEMSKLGFHNGVHCEKLSKR